MECLVQNAQEFGVKAGVNLANLNTDGDIDGKTSFYLGAVAEFGLSESFALQPELVYSMQGADELDLSYINIPVLAKYYLVEGLAVEVGPQFGFVVDDVVFVMPSFLLILFSKLAIYLSIFFISLLALSQPELQLFPLINS
ncbi:outer membrane beta-barrel protein [Mesonia mobilis]|uniref:outer membrane beta-barrel protein n=1 Tax=Mesonia mobilis TaxID=369791 RepID=UPI0026F19935|nr:outer membrane beta-barrel protein [Mesonia mobilis]